MIPETYIWILYSLIGILWLAVFVSMRREKKEKTNVISLEEKEELNRLLDYEEMRN